MTRRMAFNSFRRSVGVITLLGVATAQGAAGRPGEPLGPPTVIAPPTLRGLPERTLPKYNGPTFEPLRLDNLFGPRTGETLPPGNHSPMVAIVHPELHADFVAYVRQFEAKRAEKAGMPDRIRDAIALLHLGRHTDGIEALLAIEESYPGLYETAANLSIAYERAGRLEEAVVWIAYGIERNPEMREGAGWLHAAILHAKLKLREDTDWLEEHSVLDRIGERNPAEVLRAIEHQLGERLRWVQPKDPVMCDLFYQAAIRVTGNDAEARRAHYLRESLRFGSWRKAEIAARSKT